MSLLCVVPECDKRATFGACRVATHCGQHRGTAMRDVRHPSCVECYRRPSYGLKGTRFATHCHVHKTPGLVNVKHVFCHKAGCDTLASFGVTQNRPTHCFAHKSGHMTNVKATMCQYPSCKNLKPKYGNHVVGRIFCYEHYDHTQHWRLSTCRVAGCRRIATHSVAGRLPFQHCEGHCHENESSYLESRCRGCHLSSLCDADQLCLLTCSSQASHHGKYSEHALHRFFKSCNLSFVYDKQPDTGCTKRRPDFLFATLYGVLIVENDEHRHYQYTAECELARMQELWLSLGEATHFVRFNPDVTSNHTESLESRHLVLLNIIRPILDDPESFFRNNPGLTVQYLFYD